MSEKELLENIERSIKVMMEEFSGPRKTYGDWETRFVEETKKIAKEDLSLRVDHLKTFRGRHIFVSDRPFANFLSFYSDSPLFYAFIKLFNFISGRRRGAIREALDIFDVLEKTGNLPLLKKYPTPQVGHPLTIRHRGYEFTFRYIRHIYLLSLFLKHLRPSLADDAIVLDIGSSYGIFSSLVKQELPRSHHVLVDLSGQLILAHYYLGSLFPNAKIASFVDTMQTPVLDRNFIKQYNFVLIPTFLFDRLAKNSVDVATNFISFFEMEREWYLKYIRSDVFKTAPHVFTVNRYDAYPTYQNGLTFLDFPFSDFETLLIQTCPFLRFYYEPNLFFWYKPVQYPSQFFQFIGSRKG